jgi:epoxide hydrolase 4
MVIVRSTCFAEAAVRRLACIFAVLVCYIAVGGAFGVVLGGCSSEPAPLWINCGTAAGGPVYSQHAIGDLKSMNIACQGSTGPTVVLLHGFPDFARGWHKVMAELAKDHIVIAPDQRGYNITSGPEAVAGYKIDELVGDIKALLDKTTSATDGTAKGGKVTLVGHDWGGAVAWTFANKHPALLNKLVIVNGPHPDVFINEYNTNPKQKAASSYMAFFTTPGSEAVLKANEHKLLIDAFGSALSDEDKAEYRKLFAASDLVKMLNWYRANLDTTAGTIAAANITIAVPTLVAWGMKDSALLAGNLNGLDKYVQDLKIQHFATATHWVPHEQPAAVAKAVADFTAGLPIAATATES